MAEYTVTHACGHEGVVTLEGARRNADWRLRREAEKLCYNCFMEKVSEERARERKEAIASEKAAGLPKLKGTPRQVEWARAIRKEIGDKIADSHVRLDYVSPEALEEVNDAIDLVVDEVMHQTEAKWWIDRHRGFYTPDFKKIGRRWVIEQVLKRRLADRFFAEVNDRALYDAEMLGKENVENDEWEGIFNVRINGRTYSINDVEGGYDVVAGDEDHPLQIRRFDRDRIPGIMEVIARALDVT